MEEPPFSRSQCTYLVSKDHIPFAVSKQVATFLVQNVDKKSVRLINDVSGANLFCDVHSDYLEKVIDYCQYHAEKLLPEDNGVHCAWDEMFIAALNPSQLFRVAKAANYFQLFGLMDLAGRKITEAWFPILVQIGLVNIFDPAFETKLLTGGVRNMILDSLPYQLACELDNCDLRWVVPPGVKVAEGLSEGSEHNRV